MLTDILRLDDLGRDVWRAHTPPSSGRPDIYGGQVAAQALRAASRTVDDVYLCSSLHCLFLRRGNPAMPLDLRVTRVRTGRTYATRHVDVVQGDRTIFTMLASFHVEEPGPEVDAPMPDGVPAPEDLPPAPASGFAQARAFELRRAPVEGSDVRWWGRFTEPLPDDPGLHVCALVYASDMGVGGAPMAAAGFDPGPPAPGERPGLTGNFGSLDHAVWVHRVPDANEWFFCEAQTLAVRDSRGLLLGRLFDRAGRPLATLTQEVFLKPALPG